MKNSALHGDNFGAHAEWHFFATPHGKSACDGLRENGSKDQLAMTVC